VKRINELHPHFVIMNYTTKWVEAKPLHDNTMKSIVKFLYGNIITQFDCLTHLVSDQREPFHKCFY
jgi:hypothetical protein